MPAYATPAQLREALAPAGDVSAATAAQLSDAQLTDALSDAQAEVDARVPQAPFTDVPELVSTITVDIAAYLATLTHRKGAPLADDHPVSLRYKRAQMLLTAAAKGDLDLTEEPDRVIGEAFVQNPYEGDLFTLADAGLALDRRYDPPWVR